MRLVNPILAVLVFLPARAPAQELQLLMVEREGCIYCARWDREIAPIWPKTAEGQAAPLRRLDIDDPMPDDVALAGRVIFTPTFVMLACGHEVSRLEGYPGADFFWPILTDMISDVEAMDHACPKPEAPALPDG